MSRKGRSINRAYRAGIGAPVNTPLPPRNMSRDTSDRRGPRTRGHHQHQHHGNGGESRRRPTLADILASKGVRLVGVRAAPDPVAAGWIDRGTPEHLPHARRYESGRLRVIVGIEYGRWHLSVSHRFRLPTWEEVKDVRAAFLPAECFFVQAFPPPRFWLNLNENTLHLFELGDPLLMRWWAQDGGASEQVADACVTAALGGPSTPGAQLHAAQVQALAAELAVARMATVLEVIRQTVDDAMPAAFHVEHMDTPEEIASYVARAFDELRKGRSELRARLGELWETARAAG